MHIPGTLGTARSKNRRRAECIWNTCKYGNICLRPALAGSHNNNCWSLMWFSFILSKLKVLRRPVTVVWYCRHPSGALKMTIARHWQQHWVPVRISCVRKTPLFKPVVICALNLVDLDVPLPVRVIGGVKHKGQRGGFSGVKVDCGEGVLSNFNCHQMRQKKEIFSRTVLSGVLSAYHWDVRVGDALKKKDLHLTT